MHCFLPGNGGNQEESNLIGNYYDDSRYKKIQFTEKTTPVHTLHSDYLAIRLQWRMQLVFCFISSDLRLYQEACNQHKCKWNSSAS